ncbi:MAG: M23 family metallopeptidase [Bacillota bacterium]|nr:M23 family metallopeptidase [Bacillota bacterium]
MLDYIKQNKIYGVVVIALILAVAIFFAMRPPAYAVLIDGEKEFIVKHTSDVQQALEKLSIQEINGQDEQLVLGSTLEFKRVFVATDQVVPVEQIEEEIKKHFEFQISATSIVINGNTVVSVANKEVAQGILDHIKSAHSWITEDENLLSVDFEENIEIKDAQMSVSQVMTEQETWNLLTTGTNSPEEYVVEEGDNLWTIARKNDMYVDDILVANNLKEDDYLQLGQKIILNKTKPYVTVLAKVEGERNEVIPFETKVVTDKNASYSVTVKQNGVQGEKQVTYVEVRRNGIADKTDILKEEIIKKAVDKIIVKGSRVTTVASRGGVSGSLAWPVYGTITQYYKGSAHTGLDIAANSGTPLKAADAGVVTYAGRNGGYGNFIIINHKNGFVTRYAHCSRFAVSVGAEVARGQVIAYMGNTGRSTGPHLHFEVLINGSFTNPLSSLR